jgi:deferrochelatase/peroxidase EfeB
MNDRGQEKPSASRRGFLSGTAALVAGAGLTAGGAKEAFAGAAAPSDRDTQNKQRVEPFWGKHQSGIVTPAQSYTYFAAFDLVTAAQADVAKLLQTWTSASAKMTAGQTIEPLETESQTVMAGVGALSTGNDSYGTANSQPTNVDSGEALDLPPSRLTVTFGFGAGLFVKDGKERYGLGSRRPDAFVDLPKFTGDQLVDAHTGGDLSVQACADDPQVAFHAVRQLARLADGVAQIRWVQTGFIPNFGSKSAPRNLMGFKDGINNPSIADPKAMEKSVWVGSEGPAWMQGGSYLVARRIRIVLEHWDRMTLAFQEQTVGRHKYSGAPLGAKKEREPLDLHAADKDGNPVIPENSHVRLAAAASNDGAQILRRPYSYNDGVNFTTERWPPWRQGMEYDAGLFFLAYQRDPRTGFIKIFDKMSKLDMMNQFVTHVGGGLFACPCGAAEGEFIGQRLFDGA